MKYFAAVVSKDEIEPVVIVPPFRILASYHYFKKKKDLIIDCLTKGYEVFIDSGAFSAETKGVPIDIDEYCKFIHETGAQIYAGLDVIGNAEKTWENTKYMEGKGLKPIPTFHLGSDPKDIYRLFTYDYIALGGLVFSSGTERYCDEIWNIILKNAPNIKVHGFGMTNVELMARYPWYSVDSSSYKGGRRFGRINILWNGFDWKTFSEEEFFAYLQSSGHQVLQEGTENKNKWKLYDFYSVQSYKLYGDHLKALNRNKDFGYLSGQNKLF